MPPLIARIAHNKIEAYGEVVLSNFFAHLSYPFLFTDQGFPERYKVPGSGIVPFTLLPFMLVGSYFIIKKKPRISLLLFLWLATGILGSSSHI